MTRILGIDPGSRVTGFGIIEASGTRVIHVASGCLQVKGETLALRLRAIFDGLSEVIRAHAPQEVAIEQVFVHRNPDSALKLGQARGAAICAAAIQAMPLFEYSPAQVKQAVVGTGAAAKLQIQYMVGLLLRLSEPVKPDAADALAVALCHGHHHQVLGRVSEVRGWRRGRWR